MKYRIRIFASALGTSCSDDGAISIIFIFWASSDNHFETQVLNYFGYLNQISATPSCEPIKKPFGISGNGFEAITARSAA